ncbi:prepilin-type N-terminal cleavage/methylation domain-containing protein [Lysobacter sp. A289]
MSALRMPGPRAPHSSTRQTNVVPTGARRRRVAGFTLIEVLLATVLLAAGLALAFATLSAASQTTTRGELLAQRSEQVRAVEGFLRKRLAAARPLAFSTGQDDALPRYFIGEPGRMRFVANLPDYLGRGGPYLHDFRVEADQQQVRIVLALNIVVAGQTIEDPEQRPAELLAGGLGAVAFRYRGMDPDRPGLGDWQDSWDHAGQLPRLVEVEFTDADGRKWPTLVVALPQAGAVAGIAPGAGW